MALYKYNGRDNTGSKVTGSVQADSIDEISRYLLSRGITPIDIKKSKAFQKDFGNIAEGIFGRNVQPKEVLTFVRQMAALSAAGVPIIRAVKQLAKSARTSAMKKTLTEVAEAVEAGRTLASALGDHPKIFTGIFVGVIDVGENTGHLDDSFAQTSLFLEKKLENRKRLISAVRYPMMVVISIIIAVIIMNIFVIPKFSAVFAQVKTKLPWATRVLIATSNFMNQHWLFGLIMLAVIIIGIRFILTIPVVRYYWDKFKLKIPVVGPIQRRIVLSQFTWTFSMILRSGVPILKGIMLAAGVAGNAFITSRLMRIRDAVDQGEGFARALDASELFDASAVQMIEVGEETGKLDDMMSKVSLSYESDVDYDLKNLNDLLEPMILALLGVFVAILALAIYLPMWELTEAIK
ncbi:MAG: type II secretion system F family protein [Gammaproteobacteria bacterium]|nr:type II secretion system F family protein [Gammaproteobacteria bacterium]